MTLTLLKGDHPIPPEVEKKIRAQEKAIKKGEREAHRARMAWRKSVEENLVKGLRESMKELWANTDLEVRLLAGHFATVAVHTVVPDAEQLEQATAAAIEKAQKPKILDADGNPIGA